MHDFIILILGIITLYLLFQRRYEQRLIRDFSNSIREGKSFIMERPFFVSRNFPLESCQMTLDENANQIAVLKKKSDQTAHAFNEILGGMLDGAIILNRDHVITFANPTAEKNFSGGKKMHGRRLEALIDSFEILDLLDQISRGEPSDRTEFFFRKNESTKAFEVAIALLCPIRSGNNDVYLLLFREVTEIKKAERLRKDFVANASHELRTPVTMIKGFAETLVESTNIPSNQQASFLKKIYRNSLRLQALIDDLLTLSELEGSEQPYNPTNNKLSEVIRGINHFIQEKTYVDPAKLKFSFASEREAFPFDAIKVAIAISNLIDNAFKYAGDFTEVKISTKLSEDEQKIVCSVSDDGRGIPPKELNRIFERFYVVDKGRSREKGGTGLGLSIVKHVAELHGGRVYASSQLEKGSTFSIELPRFPKS